MQVLLVSLPGIDFAQPLITDIVLHGDGVPGVDHDHTDRLAGLGVNAVTQRLGQPLWCLPASVVAPNTTAGGQPEAVGHGVGTLLRLRLQHSNRPRWRIVGLIPRNAGHRSVVDRDIPDIANHNIGRATLMDQLPVEMRSGHDRQRFVTRLHGREGRFPIALISTDLDRLLLPGKGHLHHRIRNRFTIDPDRHIRLQNTTIAELRGNQRKFPVHRTDAIGGDVHLNITARQVRHGPDHDIQWMGGNLHMIPIPLGRDHQLVIVIDERGQR